MAEDIPKYKREYLHGDVQQPLLALLAYDLKHGTNVAAQVPTGLFDKAVRPLADSIIAYRQKYKKPPRSKQLPALVEQLAVNEEQKKALRLIAAKLKNTLKGVNREFLAAQARDFAIRQNNKKQALAIASLAIKPNHNIEELKKKLQETLRFNPEELYLGMTLDEERSLDWLNEETKGYLFGIKPFDDGGITMDPGTLILYLAPKGTGKSWFCIHCGRQVLKQGGKVLHITLEMSEQKVAKRYHQSFNAMARNMDKFVRARLRRNGEEVTHWEIELREPKLAETDPRIRQKLLKQMGLWKEEFSNLRIKQFPSSSFTTHAFLTYLEQLDHIGFHPDLVIVDYPDIMKIDPKNFRLESGQIFVDLRSAGIERQFVTLAPSQVNRPAFDAELITSTNAAESMIKVNTADIVLSFNQTMLEHKAGLARVYAEHARDTSDNILALITQSYNTGQYVVDATRMNPDSALEKYWKEQNSDKKKDKDKDKEAEPASEEKPKRERKFIE